MVLCIQVYNAPHFRSRYGISIEDFTQIGFILYLYFTKYPILAPNFDWSELGVTRDDVDCVLRLISLAFPDAVKKAREERSKIAHTADKPSILRQSPCLQFGDMRQRTRAPLPELIIERVTSGVFYDVVSGGGSIRADYGRRFEDYCYNLFSDMLPAFQWKREFRYRKKPNTFDSPDIICMEAGELIFASECKATRMSHEAMFGREPTVARGYADLAKAVFQLWRYFSHCRRGYIKCKMSKNAVGIVLTLDKRLVMATPLQEFVMNTAVDMATNKDGLINSEDMKSIVFVAIPELERSLSHSNEKIFKKSLNDATLKEFHGWRLDSIVKNVVKDHAAIIKNYPYGRKLHELLPWFGEVESRNTKTE